MDRHVGRLIALVAIGIIIAVVKPWGAESPHAAAVPTPLPSPSPTPRPSVVPLNFDFRTFGTNEPPPSWEIWPAGNLASFYFAMRIDMTTRTAAPGASVAPTSVPVSGADPADVPAAWPTVRIPFGSTLDLIGINHPVGYSVEIVGLSALDGAKLDIHSVLGDSPWPDHFSTIGVVGSDGSDRMVIWPAGRYRLDVRIEPGAQRRSIEVDVERNRDTAAPSSSPGRSD